MCSGSDFTRSSETRRPPRLVRPRAPLYNLRMPHDDVRRSSPDVFLRLLEKSRRGKLKIYIGHAAGVGKTYQMLEDAHALKDKGVDVVIGVIETHGRAETQAKIGNLESVARRVVAYKGKNFEEMDLPGILSRKPELVLVDELAHTNVPGVENEKRYQDVEEILDAGISVMTTVNTLLVPDAANLQVRKSGSPATAVPGQLLEYSIFVTNTSRSDRPIVADFGHQEKQRRLAMARLLPRFPRTILPTPTGLIALPKISAPHLSSPNMCALLPTAHLSTSSISISPLTMETAFRLI